MPEVINLLSSTPPPSADRREPSSLRRFHSSPPAPADLRLIPILSDDFDFSQFTFDDEGELDKPSKKRRLSPEPEAGAQLHRNNHTALPSRNQNSLFLFSDEIVPSDGASKAHTKQSAFTLESDPIVFTSSAPEPTRRNPSPERRNDKQRGTTKASGIFSDDDSDNNGIALGGGGKEIRRPYWKDNIEDFSDPVRIPDPSELFNLRESDFAVPALPSEFSGRTADLLARLGEHTKNGTGNTARTNSKPRRTQVGDEDEDDPDELPEPREPQGMRKLKRATTSTKQTTADKEAKTKDREAAKAQRDREKQLEKERKQKEKEEKAKDKQFAADIAQANKLKLDKKISTPEMIVDLSSTFEETSVGNQAIEYMRRLEVEHSFFDSPIPKIVKWRRKMKARYNDTLGYWEPCDLRITEEEHVLCLVTAQEFVGMATSSLGCDTPDAPSELELHVIRLKSTYPRCTVIYLIEGLAAWMRRNTSSRNRAYQAEFRRNLDQVQASSSTSSSTNRRKKTTTNKSDPPSIDDDTVEDALLNLQVTHGCLIHQTAAPPESAEWIKTFTEQVSTIPYRRQRMEDNDSAFCMDGGQVKPGENTSDTYVRMLQEVSRVTASMAYGIVNEYPSVVELVRGMQRSGAGMLEDVKKSANKNGAITESRIGPAASRRLYKVFMGLDPHSTDI
ncbi:ERCC4 domain-containing protein [Aspergillus cavernicola]|uniref:ERCC4 domain-containing protein n=1 Tax=Aspergillus cavernicola TaxID=176166 RepID=A0ABR4HSM9_9EURO